MGPENQPYRATDPCYQEKRGEVLRLGDRVEGKLVYSESDVDLGALRKERPTP